MDINSESSSSRSSSSESRQSVVTSEGIEEMDDGVVEPLGNWEKFKLSLVPLFQRKNLYLLLPLCSTGEKRLGEGKHHHYINTISVAK